MNLHLYPTQMLQAEYPIGDPFGGPAYGRREMPVVAIAVAIGSFVAGATIATAAGATFAAMVAGGAMMVGAALTVVGTVTGNQNLVKWGGILSLAGGVGAGVLGLTGGLTEGIGAAETTGSAIGAGDADQALASQQVGNAAVAAPPPTEPTGLMPTEAAANPSLAGAQPPVEPLAPAPAPEASAPAAPAATPFNAPAPSTSSAFTPAAPAAPSAFQPAAPVTDLSRVATPGAEGGIFTQAGQWMRTNPELARAGLSATGMLASSVIPKPLNDLDRAQANYYNTRTAIERMRSGQAPGWWYGRPAGG